MIETIKRLFKDVEGNEKFISERFDKEYCEEIRKRIMKLHEELKRVCEDNGIMMVEYYNFYDLLKDPKLYMVFNLEAIIIDVKSHAAEYRKALKDGTKHTIVYSYQETSESVATIGMCARLTTKKKLGEEIAKEKLEFLRLRNEMLKKKLAERTDRG